MNSTSSVASILSKMKKKPKKKSNDNDLSDVSGMASVSSISSSLFGPSRRNNVSTVSNDSKDSGTTCTGTLLAKAEQALKEEREVKRLVSAADIRMVGRETEVAALQGALGVVLSDKSDTTSISKSPREGQNRARVISITGKAGTGKSCLAQEIVMPGSYICRGKYTANGGETGLAGCMKELVDQIISRDLDQDIRKRLKISIRPNDAAVLIESFPALSTLFEENESATKEVAEMDKTRRAKRREFLFFQFIEIVASQIQRQRQHQENGAAAAQSLVMILDDTQWADRPSMELMGALIRDPDLENFVLVTTSRPPEKKNGTSAFLQELDRWKNFGVSIRSIALENLSESDVNVLVAQLLDCEPYFTEPLGKVIYLKTSGNPFFTIEFLRKLVDEDLVKYNFGKMEWDFNINRIQGTGIGANNAVDLVKGRLQKLPSRYQLLLLVAACLGPSFDEPLLESIICQIEASSILDGGANLERMDIEPSLNACVDFGLLHHSSKVYVFVHDLVREAALGFGNEQQNKLLKMRVGKCILQAQETNSLFFVGVDLFNASAPLLNHGDVTEWIILARYNYLAGQKAMRESAFALALHYLETGAGYLDSHDISESEEANMLLLNLLADAADAVYCVEDYERISLYTIRVLETLYCPDETRYRMNYLQVLAALREEKSQKAVDIGRETINQLGIVKFPKSPGTGSVLVELLKTKMLLRKHTEDSLLALPTMSDERRLVAARFIEVIQTPAYLVCQEFGNVTFFKSLRWTLKYGLSRYAPSQFIIWGFLQQTIFGDFEANIFFSEIGLKLAERLDIRETTSKATLLCFALCRHWSTEARACYSPFQFANKLAMEGGDLETALLCNTNMDIFDWCTAIISLQELGRRLDGHTRLNRACKHKACTTQTVGIALGLGALCLQDDAAFTWLQDPGVACSGKAPDESTQCLFDAIDLQVKYTLGEISEALKIAKRTEDLGVKRAAGLVYISRAHFFRGLLFLEAARAGDNSRANMQAANRVMGMMKKWIDGGDVNCRHMFCLLEAETARVSRKMEKAKELYAEAIKTSRQAKYDQDAALCNERAALLYVELEDKASASHHMEEAVKGFQEYGATKKVEQLRKEYKTILSGSASAESAATSEQFKPA